MRLNPDCIRDILLTVEENTSYSELMSYDSDIEYERLSPYTVEEVMYHIRQCDQSNLISKVSYYMGGGCTISDLTPSGHEFIANIRTDTNWNKTKETAKSVGSYSLNALTTIASEIIANIISSQLNP